MRWPRWRRLLIVAAMVPCLGAAMLAQTSIYVLGRGGIFTTPVFFPDGTASAPSISFASETTKGFYSNAASQIAVSIGGTARHTFTAGGINNLSDSGTLTFGASSDTALTRAAAGKITLTGTTPMIQLGGTSSSFPALKQSSTTLQVRLADDSALAGIQAGDVSISRLIQSGVLVSGTAPTISSGFGTSPSIASNNGTGSFTVNVGTGGVATSGVIGLPAASNGWNCFVSDQTTNVATRQTASTTTTATVTAASAWTASDILIVSCFGR